MGIEGLKPCPKYTKCNGGSKTELVNMVDGVFLKCLWCGELSELSFNDIGSAFANKIKAEAVREAFKKAEIPEGAKAGCIGEFSIYIENGGVCPNCYSGSCDEDEYAECEVCHGESNEGLLDVSYDIPWTTQKEIFKAFCKYAEIELDGKLERGEL